MVEKIVLRQDFWQPPIVTAKSTDAEIIAAVDKAGDNRLSWRKHDWPKDGSNNTKAWVRPSDIGFSDKKDTALLKRMRELVAAGHLEERPVTTSYTERRALSRKRGIVRRMFPRFRVVPKDK